jgi:hypothetical protein
MAPWWGPQPSESEKALTSLREHVANAGSSALGRTLSRDETNQATGSLVALTVAGATGTLWSVAGRRRRAAAAAAEAEAQRLVATRAGGVLGSTISAVASVAADAKAIPSLKKGLDASHKFVDEHGDRAVAEATKAAARASDAARGAAVRSQARLVSVASEVQSSVLGRAVRLRRNVMIGGLVVVFVYAAGRATPGALIRWGRSGSSGADNDPNASARGLHVPEAAKGALNRAKNEAQAAMNSITSSSGNETSGEGVGTHGRHLLGGVAATATVIACIQCASCRK